jgi:hypothetical protein
MAQDGTRGYAFSNAFRVYDETKESPPAVGAEAPALSGRVDLIFSRAWRPEYFQVMIDSGRIDLDYITLRFGIFTDGIRKQVRIELPAASQVFDYSDMVESAGLYAFTGTPLKIRIESDNRLVCYWTEDATARADAAGRGAPDQDASSQDTASQPAEPGLATDAEAISKYGSEGSATFIVLSSDLAETLRAETLRQQKLLDSFIDAVGGSWAAPPDSPEAGRLTISKNGRFAWKGRGDATAAFVPAGAGETGNLAFRLYLDPGLSSNWEGAFSLRFDPPEGSPPRQRWLDFLYRRSPAGLVLQPAAPLAEGLTVQAAAKGSPSLLFAPATE